MLLFFTRTGRLLPVYACCLLVLLFSPLPLSAQSDSLPASFDLRDVDGKNYLSAVKNQGRLGTCYAFAATAAAESSYNMAMDLSGADAVSLSESFIVWSLGPLYEGVQGIDGADYRKDELQGLVDYGTCTEEAFPYMSTWEEAEPYETDSDQLLDYHWDTPRIQFSGWHRLPANDIETIKRAMSTFGAVDTSVYVGEEFFAYTNGTLLDDRTVADNPFEYAPWNNHAISLVGWDDNATGDGQGAWILRNSWGENWGEDGYMRIGYTSGRVALSATYLTYEDWNDYGFEHIELINTGLLSGELDTSGYQPVARGAYEWGDDTSLMINNGTITATGSVVEGDPYVHGMFLWAGDTARIENNGDIEASASTDTGQATVYGVCLQGHKIDNTGTITVNATSGNDRATAYGARFFSFDESGILANNGTIAAHADSSDGWAYGLFSSDADSVRNTGTVTATGDGYAVGILVEGQTDTCNLGSLTASSASWSHGLAMYSGSVTNNGTILSRASGCNGNATGIFAYDANGIENIRTIDALAEQENGTACGIAAFYSGEVVNAGTITAASAGAGGESTGIWMAASESFENTGTINATAAQGAVGLLAEAELSYWGGQYSNICRISNSGLIAATTEQGTVYGVKMDGGTLLNGETGVISASTTDGTAWGLYLVNSTAYNNGLVQGDTFVGDDSTLGGYGSFTGDVINDAGTVAPGNSIGTLTIDGDYIQSSEGTLEIEIGDGTSDQLIVTGTADLDGTLTLSALGYATSGDYDFLDAATILGTFDTIISPAILSAYLTSSADGFSLGVTRNTYASLAANSGQEGVGSALDVIRPAATGDMQDILEFVDTMQLGPLQSALNDMTPGMHAAATYASLQNSHRSMGYVRRHWKDLQAESGRADTPYEPSERGVSGTRFNAWGSFVGASSRTRAQDCIPEYNESMTGLVLGMDYNIGTKLTTGLTGTYTRQSLNQEDGSGSSTIKTFRGYLYGLWDEHPEAKGLYVATALGFGSINFDTDRDIAFLDREAESDHSGRDYSLSAATGYDIENGNWTIRPSLNLEYVFLHEDGYDESDAGDMNLHVSSHDSQSLQSTLGMSIARRCRLKKAVLIPELRFAWTHEFLSEQDDLTSEFIAAGPSFDTPGRDIPGDAALLGLAVKAPLSDTLFAAIDYECSLAEADESTDHRFNAELRIRF